MEQHKVSSGVMAREALRKAQAILSECRDKEKRQYERIETLEGHVSVLRAYLEIEDIQAPPGLEEVKEALYPLCLPSVRCGIYFLIHEGSVVYVGKSEYGPARILQHVGNKKFDQVFAMPCEKKDLLDREREWIDRLLPKYNVDFKTMRLKRSTEMADPDSRKAHKTPIRPGSIMTVSDRSVQGLHPHTPISEITRRYYSTRAVASALGIHYSTVINKIKKREIMAQKTPSGHYRITREEVIRLIDWQ